MKNRGALALPLWIAVLACIGSDAAANCPSEPPLEVSPPGSHAPLQFSDEVTLVWQEAAEVCADSFNLYKGELTSLNAGLFNQCAASSIPTNTTVDTGIPLKGRGWFYLVTGRNGFGEGTRGFDTDAVERIANIDCPSGLEACGDGTDNDGDGLADCSDPDCSGEPACSRTVCHCEPACTPDTPVVISAGVDYQHLVESWRATTFIDAIDPQSSPLTISWETTCAGLLSPGGAPCTDDHASCAELLASSVAETSHCSVTATVTNATNDEITCAVPITVSPGSAIEQDRVHVVRTGSPGSSSDVRLTHTEAVSGFAFSEPEFDLVFTYDGLSLPPFVIGLVTDDYLIVAQPDGGIYEVLSVMPDPVDNIITVRAREAYVTDIVEQTRFDETLGLGFASPGGSASRSSSSPTGCSPDFDGVEISNGHELSLGLQEVGFSFNPAIDVSGKIDWNALFIPELEEFKLEATADLGLDLVSGAVASGQLSLEAIGDIVNCNWYITFAIGPVPVLLEPVLALEAGFTADVSAEAGVTQRFEYSDSIGAVVEYEDGSWSSSAIPLSGGFTFHDPELSIVGAAEMEVFIGPRLELNFYAVAGPVVNAQAYLGFEVMSENAATFDWGIPAGLRGSITGQIKILEDASLPSLDFGTEFTDPGCPAPYFWCDFGAAKENALSLDVGWDFASSEIRIHGLDETENPPLEILDCTPGGPSVCQAFVTQGTRVVLTPVSTEGIRFDGFSGDADCANWKVRLTNDLRCLGNATDVEPFNAGTTVTNLWAEIDALSPGAEALVRWSHDSNRLLRTAGENLHLFDASTGLEIDTITPDAAGDVTALDASPRSDQFALGYDDRPRGLGVGTGGCDDISQEPADVCLWPWDTKDANGLADRPNVKGVAWSPSGRSFVSAEAPTRLTFWTDEGVQCGERDTVNVAPFQGVIQDLTWSPDDRFILVSFEGRNEAVYVGKGLDPACGNWTLVGQLGSFCGAGGITSIAWSPDARFFAVGCADSTIEVIEETLISDRVILDAPGGGISYTILAEHTAGVTDLVWHPDGTELASVSIDGTVKIWEVDNFFPQGVSPSSFSYFSVLPGGLRSVDWSRDGRYLALGGTTLAGVEVLELD